MRVLVVSACLAGALLSRPADLAADPVESPARVCSPVDGVLPAHIDLPKSYVRRVATMLQRSPTFREQCRRLADAPWVHVLVRPDLRFVDLASRKAASVFRRPAPGRLEVVVTLHPVADAALWLSHELEHVIEQMENRDLRDMTRRRLGAWRSGPGLFETARAVQAGRTVLDEVRFYRADERTAE